MRLVDGQEFPTKLPYPMSHRYMAHSSDLNGQYVSNKVISNDCFSWSVRFYHHAQTEMWHKVRGARKAHIKRKQMECIWATAYLFWSCAENRDENSKNCRQEASAVFNFLYFPLIA